MELTSRFVDVPMTAHNKIVDCLVGALGVVHAHPGCSQTGAYAVDLDNWETTSGQGQQRFTTFARWGDDQAIDLLRSQQVQVLFFALQILIRVAKDRVVAMRDELVLNAARRSCKEGVPDVGNDKADLPRRIGDQSTGDRIGAVVEGTNGV